MNESWFLVLRAAHVLLAALWLGAAFMLSAFVMPAVRDVGPGGGQFMRTLHRRKFHAFMALAAILTVLTGLWLYWRFTAGLDEEVILSPGGLAFGIGGICGLLAMILGGAVLGRGFARMVALGELAAGSDSERATHMQDITVLRQRMSAAGKFILLLMVVALVLMAIGHYV